MTELEGMSGVLTVVSMLGCGDKASTAGENELSSVMVDGEGHTRGVKV